MGQLRVIGLALSFQGGNRINKVLLDRAEDVHIQLGVEDVKIHEGNILRAVLPHPR